MKNQQSGIGNWFKKSFESVSGKPSSEVWENISRKLDQIDEINARQIARRTWIASASAVIMSVVGFMIFLSQQVGEKNQVAYTESKLITPFKNTSEIHYNIKKRHKFFGENQKNNPGNNRSSHNIEPPKNGIISVSDSPDLLISPKTNNNHIADEYYVAPAPYFMPMLRVNYILNSESQKSENQYFDYGRNSEAPAPFTNISKFLLPKGFYIGLSLSINKISLLNHDTYRAMETTSLSENIATYGKDFTIVAGLNISDRSGLQSEVMLSSQKGQIYNQYDEGKFKNRKYSLNYSGINLMYKMKNARIGFNGMHPVSFNFTSGFYTGILRSASLVENGEKSSIIKEFNRFDYGAIFGAEYELFLSDTWMFSLGARSSLSLRNIYKGNSKIPGDFNKTSNMALGFNLGLKYMLP